MATIAAHMAYNLIGFIIIVAHGLTAGAGDRRAIGGLAVTL